MFHPVVDAWFRARYSEPTPVQAGAWPLIAAGQDVLLTAPTGSGKTLAAFLACLDRLFRQAVEGRLEDRTAILYISPLKALSNDVRRNVDEPLAELAAAAVAAGLPRPEIRTAVRTGDTPAHERRLTGRRPPHVMVTTPESLFILLTAESSRRWLADVRTVIVDEIHAVAGDKRGAHLALSLERLAELVAAPGGAARLQRIGLSATVRPIQTAARLLVGAERPLPEIVNVGQRRDMDLAIEVLGDELGAVCTNEQWEEIYDRVAALARGHRSTLVFVNTRRLVERVTRHLADRLGAERVAAHHSSLSRHRRFDAEQRLKSGELSLVVATASLELGIDVGTVDLTCLIGSPRSIATALQRVGRSGHALLATPKGRLFPLTRDQLVECAALVRAARRGEIDRLGLRRAPLDVLAQQIVAMCACEEQDEDRLFEACRRAAPYAGLTREDFDQVVDMLAEGIATRRGRHAARLHRDAVGRRLTARRGARLAALTSGGAIPDNASYEVVLEPDETTIGSLDEDFAIESMAGDVILLGNSSWRIRRIESGRVRVEDAGGAPSTIPFWLGEGPARTLELSAELSAVRQGVADRLDDPERAAAWLEQETGLDRRGALLARDYIAAAQAALGAVPTRDTVVVERFFDEAGGMQLVVHAPFGGRINRAWGMALRKRLCHSFNFELQAAATDDGVLLSLGPQHSFPLEAVFEMLHPSGIEELLTQAALQAPMFNTRWRWNANRALALLRWQNGRKVPPYLQRMRAEDLLVAVFPAQLACQDNMEAGPIEVPDHPLVRETLRDCLTEAMDIDGLRATLTALHDGQIRRVTRETPEPSVFAHEILNANPYAFLDDAPLEERRARAVTLRRGLPAAVADDVGRLDPAAITAVVEEAWPDLRNADELHDLLLDLGALPEGDAGAWAGYLDELIAAGRAARLRHAGRVFWVPAERRALAATVWPHYRFEPDVVEPPARRAPGWADRAGALVEIVRARLGLVGPTTAAALAAALDVGPGEVDAALAAIEAEGGVLRGRFTPDSIAAEASRNGKEPQLEWCERRLLARIHRRTLDGLRRLIEPVSPAVLLRFLLSWQHARPATQPHGRDGLLRVIERLQGFEAAAGVWERDLLPARVAGYQPAWLDELCLSGEVTWGRLARHESARHAGRRLSATVPVALLLRRELAWLLEPRPAPAAAPADPAPAGAISPIQPSGPARDVLAHLERVGASFVDDIAAGVRRLRIEVEEALCELVTAGLVTGDGFAGLRSLLHGEKRRRVRPGRPVAARPSPGTGRWARLMPPATPAADDVVEAKARQYVKRYGVVFRDLLQREPGVPAWRDLLRVYRRLEMRGDLRGGRIVGGFVGEQFAAPEALSALRAIRREEPSGQTVRLSACDPLNLVGIITPGPRVPATPGHHVAYRDGVPVLEEPRPHRARASARKRR
ncbi:MAG: DEAD/DEAH box helicase [Candidatus Rokuibacteriota bacterium]